MSDQEEEPSSMRSTSLFPEILAITLALSTPIAAQTFSGSPSSSAFHAAYDAGTTADESDDDPGYALYKSGYNMVMNEQWQEARSIFQELARSFPESQYRDDALYWFGYCGSQTNELSDAIDAYNQLIHEFPGSQYYDDAVADLTAVQTEMQIEQLSRELERSGALLDDRRMTLHERDIERQLKRLTWNRHVFPAWNMTKPTLRRSCALTL